MCNLGWGDKIDGLFLKRFIRSRDRCQLRCSALRNPRFLTRNDSQTFPSSSPFLARPHRSPGCPYRHRSCNSFTIPSLARLPCPLSLTKSLCKQSPLSPFPQPQQVAITANKMATKEDYEKTGATAGAKVHKIRITLTSRNVKNLEKCGYLHGLGLNRGLV